MNWTKSATITLIALMLWAPMKYCEKTLNQGNTKQKHASDDFLPLRISTVS
jgi:hypothetical protein